MAVVIFWVVVCFFFFFFWWLWLWFFYIYFKVVVVLGFPIWCWWVMGLFFNCILSCGGCGGCMVVATARWLWQWFSLIVFDEF